MRGEKDLQKLVSVHFLRQELGQYLIKERPGMLFFIFNKDAIGILVAHDLKQGEFVLQVPFYPPQQKLEDFSSEMCKRLIYKLVGQELADVNMMDIKRWVMQAEVAEKFLSCNNRIILAGDAAHRFPPAGGFVHRALNDTVSSILPSVLQRTILDGIFSIGRAQLSDFVLNGNNPLGSARLAKLRQIFEEGQSLQLQFPAEDLDFRYRKGALVSEDDRVLNVHEAPIRQRRDYIHCSEPGSRLPYMNVKLFSNSSSKEIFSTLDLVSGDKVEFVLIIAPSGSIDGTGRSEAALTPWKSFEEVVEVKRSSDLPSWWDICQMTDRGAILVRPDEHITWRTNPELQIPS